MDAVTPLIWRPIVCGLLLSGVVQQPSAPGPQKPLIPLAASTLADHPERYFGENVTLTGAVERTFSSLAFSIDQDKARSTGKDVLVLARMLTGTVQVNSHVTVIGEVVRVDPDDVARSLKEYGADLAAEIAQKYRGRPAVLAASVISAAGIDLARRPPPPMTAAEAAYAEVMKHVAAANGTLRKAVEASDAAITRDSAAALKQAFTKTADFWKARGRADAATWSDDARTLAESIDRAAAGGAWDEIKTSAEALGQTCQKCHAAYRERLDDGTYRIRRDLK